jgi:hypothetical protein
MELVTLMNVCVGATLVVVLWAGTSPAPTRSIFFLSAASIHNSLAASVAYTSLLWK